MSSTMDSRASHQPDYSWTTGGKENLVHKRVIDRGGYGDVHEICETNSNKVFARKLVRLGGGNSLQVILNEERAIVKLSQSGVKNIVTVLQFGFLENSPNYYFLDMELCDITLGDYISGELPSEFHASFNVDASNRMVQVWRIMLDICNGVDFIHDQQEVHRDLKPNNVLYSLAAGAWKVADFGLTAEGTSKRAVETVFARGTPGYRAPELVNPDDDKTFTNKVDIWAMGCILYEIVCRKKAFENDFRVHQHCLEQRYFKRELGIHIDSADISMNQNNEAFVSKIIHNMLQIEPSKRPAVKDLCQLFEDLLAPTSQESPTKGELVHTRSDVTLQDKSDEVDGVDEQIERATLSNLPVEIEVVTEESQTSNSGSSALRNQVSGDTDEAAQITHFPAEPRNPFIYSPRNMVLPPTIYNNLSWIIAGDEFSNRSYQELLHAYIHVTAPRLDGSSPCYFELWRSYVPAMAFGQSGSLPLLNAIAAITALQIAPLQRDPEKGRERAERYYFAALEHHHILDTPRKSELDDAMIATAMLLAHYDVWKGELAKMAFHVGGAKQVIIKRGKKASQTPLGRALFASYFRMDITMSVIMGNPVFLDESWWMNDPLTKYPITPETPILTAVDIALSKLTVIIAKITLLKQSAATRRQKMIAHSQNEEIAARTRQLHEARIREQVENIQQEVNDWERGLPTWFRSCTDTSNDDTLFARPYQYVHPFIPSVLSCSYTAKIHLWRILNPHERQLPASIHTAISNVMRTFPGIPENVDLMIIPNVWSAGLFLQDVIHRAELEELITERSKTTDFFFWKFCLNGLRHGWASESEKKKPFKSLLGDAQEVVPGVSENLYRAEGVMQLTMWNLEGMDEEEQEDRRPMYRFAGETSLFSAADDEELDADYQEARIRA